MKMLKRTLRDYVNQVVGGAASSTEDLRNDLRQILGRNSLYINVATAMLAVVFVASLGMAVSQTLRAAPLPTASLLLVSAIGAARTVLNLWREKIAIEMLIAISDLDEATLRKVSARLLRDMK